MLAPFFEFEGEEIPDAKSAKIEYYRTQAREAAEALPHSQPRLFAGLGISAGAATQERMDTLVRTQLRGLVEMYP